MAFLTREKSGACPPAANSAALALALCLLLVVAGLAYADYRMGVAPSRLETEGAPGSTISGDILVINGGSDPIIVQVRVTSWKYDEQGHQIWADLTPAERGCNEWVSIAPRELRLAPKDKANVHYSVTIPPNAVGGYHAALMFLMIPDTGAPPPGEGTAPGSGVAASVSFRGQIAVPIYLTAPVAGKMDVKASAGEIEVVPPRGNQPMTFLIPLSNDGNTHIRARGKLVITDQNNAVRATVDIGERTLIPAAQQPLKAQFAGELPLGQYQALATIEYGYPEFDKVLVKECRFAVKAAGAAGDFVIQRKNGKQVLSLILENRGFVPVGFVTALDVFDAAGKRLAGAELAPAFVPPGNKLSVDRELGQSLAGRMVVARAAFGPLASVPAAGELASVVRCQWGEKEAVVELKNPGAKPLRLGGIWRLCPANAVVARRDKPQLIEPLVINPGQTARLTIGPLSADRAQEALLISVVSLPLADGG